MPVLLAKDYGWADRPHRPIAPTRYSQLRLPAVRLAASPRHLHCLAIDAEVAGGLDRGALGIIPSTWKIIFCGLPFFGLEFPHLSRRRELALAAQTL